MLISRVCSLFCFWGHLEPRVQTLCFDAILLLLRLISYRAELDAFSAFSSNESMRLRRSIWLICDRSKLFGSNIYLNILVNFFYEPLWMNSCFNMLNLFNTFKFSDLAHTSYTFISYLTDVSSLNCFAT